MPGASGGGLAYVGWDTGIFNGDKKIDKLLDAYGWRGFGVYFFLCLQAYSQNGYYCEWGYDDGSTTARRMGGGMSSQAVEEIVRLCLRVGLWDQGLFDEYGVLTSRGIQRRFLEAAKRRRSIPVYREYWLLDEKETSGLANCVNFLNLRNADAVLRNADAVLRNADAYIKKERKNNTVPFSAEKDTAPTPEEQFEIFWKSYPRKDNKKTAKQKFLLALKNKNRFEDIMAGLERDKASDQWQRDGGHYIPMPTTWINQERWNNQGVDLSALGQHKEDRMTDDMELVPNKDGVMAWRKKKK